MSMTVTCKDCGNQFGAWRPRCTTCGWHNEYQKAATSAPVAPDRERRIKREVTRRVKRTVSAFLEQTTPDQCIHCRRRKAKERCPQCNERVHRTCLRLHVEGCADFQTARKDAIEKVMNELTTG